MLQRTIGAKGLPSAIGHAVASVPCRPRRAEVGATIEGACPGAVVAEHEGAGELTIEIARSELLGVAPLPARGPPLAYVLLSDLSCADYPRAPGALRLAYHLLLAREGSRLRLRVWASTEPEVPTVTDVWATANWHEREVYDMFGVRFAGHPDLARILMPLDWEGHPLRRDYPSAGRRCSSPMPSETPIETTLAGRAPRSPWRTRPARPWRPPGARGAG